MSPSFASVTRLVRWSLSRKTSRRAHRERQGRTAPGFRPGLEILELRLNPSNQLGTLALVEGPASGTDSDIVAATGSWSATANASWLHTSSSGTGNGLASFTFDANSGTTRSGTLTIASLTLTVTQAGSTYVPANPVFTLASSGLSNPPDVAVDSAGNIYFTDWNNKNVKEWNVTTQTVSTLVSSGLNTPCGLAVDGAGNVYIADTYNNAILEWNAATRTVTTLVSSGLSSPNSVAVDSLGNVYITDSGNSVIKEWNAATHTVATLTSITGLSRPGALALDSAGNVYIVDWGNNTLKEWNAATQTVTTLVSSGLNSPWGVAVDGSGNVYVGDRENNLIKEWVAATQTVRTLVSTGLNFPGGVAVDALGNLYIADTNNSAVEERPRAFVPAGAVSEGAAAGSDQLLPVLPTNESLTGLFAPSSDQSWLTLGTPSGGVIPFAFTQNFGPARLAHITVLGQKITVTQAAAPPSLGTTSLVEGPASGTDSDIVVDYGGGSWTATGNASWLHTQSSGTGNGLAVFAYDTNTGATRSGTLTIAGLTLTVTQAGSTYVPANPVFTLASSGLSNPPDVAVDSAGNIYFTDWNNKNVKEWNVTTQTVSTLVSSGLNTPCGLAVDGAGNVYIADTYNNAILEWNAATRTVTTLVSSGLSSPNSVAVDSLGNVYITDSGNSVIKEWNAATHTVATLTSITGLSRPGALALDSAGNVYIVDWGNNTLKEWNAATQTVTTLVSSGLNSPWGVAVDGSGNVYIGDRENNFVKEWVAATQTVRTLVSTGLNFPGGVAVDALGNLYIADTNNSAVEERPRAFVPAGAVSEGAAAGSDQLLPVLPTNEVMIGVFAPSSDQSWLTLGSPSNGVIPFSFTANTGTTSRTAHITVLGQQITVTQLASTTTTLTDNGPNPSTVGQAVSFLVTVSPSVPDRETVTLEDASNGNAVVGTGTLTGGTVIISVSTLTAGTHDIFAVYGGDANYAASQSAQGAQVVNSGPAPGLSSATVNGADVTIAGQSVSLAGKQRSMVDNIVFHFNEAVTLDPGAFTIALHAGVSVNGGAAETVGTLPTLSWSSPDGGLTWVVSFSGSGVAGGSIADGDYDITMVSTAVHANGQTMTNDVTNTFYRLFGDTNGDGQVSGRPDLVAMQSALGTSVGQTGYLAYLDYNGDGIIGGRPDFQNFQARLGTIYTNLSATI